MRSSNVFIAIIIVFIIIIIVIIAKKVIGGYLLTFKYLWFEFSAKIYLWFEYFATKGLLLFCQIHSLNIQGFMVQVTLRRNKDAYSELEMHFHVSKN